MVLEYHPNSDETAEAAIRLLVRNLMVNIRNSCDQLSQQVRGRRAALEALFSGEDFEVLLEMYEKLQEIVDMVNGNPPPDLPTDDDEQPEPPGA